MAIVINGSGTVTGLAVGGLPDGTVDAGTLATNSVDSAELIDGAVDDSHIGALAASKLTGALPAISGASLTTLPAAELTGSIPYGYKNTPAFLAYSTTANGQNVPTSTWTKIVHPTEAFDSDGKFASGTFTPTVSGQYVLTGMVEMSQTDNNTTLYLKIYKNGNPVVGGRWFNYHPDGGGGGPNTSNQISIMVISDTNDYFDLYMYQNSGGRGVQNTFGDYCSHFSGYKLAGA